MMAQAIYSAIDSVEGSPMCVGCRIELDPQKTNVAHLRNAWINLRHVDAYAMQLNGGWRYNEHGLEKAKVWMNAPHAD